ncbi:MULTISPECIES: ABC transporter permease [unclassified Microcoleus]|uniref:ABC transporter permease n=1 Tax=unclassified Microcoleus TaxID=2642155 RepID=UPI0025E6E0D8|nr:MULTISPECIES: ABC transporter permease [unclassified Microcoleus]
MTNSVLIDRLGNWNPQLLRELRGRLKPHTVIATVSFSVIFQIILLLIASPNSRLFSDGWLDLWQIITWMLPYVTFTLGSYSIVNDIGQEQKRGTLNFIRLSPCPAWQILLGKMLGVPVLLYLFLGLMVPLHCLAGLQGGVSLPLIASVYLMLAPGCAICYSLMMLCGLASETEKRAHPPQATAFGVGAIACCAIAPLYMGWNINITWRPLLANSEIFGYPHPVVSWFLVPINNIGLVSHAFSLAVLGTTAFLLWRILLRNFNKPRSTAIGKRQSYAILAGIEVLALGFFLPTSLVDEQNAILAAILMYVLTVMVLLVLMLAICPQRQALLEWVGYDSPGLQSLIWSNRSPLLVAVIIHLILVGALLVPWLFWIGIGTKKLVETSLLVLCTMNAILMYATFVQQVCATKLRNPMAWAICGLGIWSFIAPGMLLYLKLIPDRNPATAALWTLFGYGFWQFDKPTTIPFVGLGILAQWVFLAFLLWRFQKTMQKLKVGT